MDHDRSVCPKCNGEMVQGHVLDNTYGGVLVSSWQKDPPKKSFWGGLKLGRPRAMLPLGAFRCQSCGYLEFYAGNEFEPT